MKKLTFTLLDRKYIMVFNIVLFSIFNLQSSVFNSSYAQTWKWANNVGGTSTDLGLGISIDTTANTYLVGSFSDTAVFASDTLISKGLEDIVIAKFDPSGNLIWGKSAGSQGLDKPQDVSIDPNGNNYVTGFYSDTAIFGLNDTLFNAGSADIFLAKYDPSGNLLWAKSAGGTGNDKGKGVLADVNGDVYITGFFEGTVIFGIGDTLFSSALRDMFLAKYSAAGSLFWAIQAGAAGDDKGEDLAQDANGNIYITGSFTDTAIFQGGDTAISAGSDDIFIAKYDSAGNLLWVTTHGGTSINEAGHAITTDDSLYIYTTGKFSGTAIFGSDTLVSTISRDIFVAKHDQAGNILWAKHASGTGDDDRGNGISIDKYGNSYIAGYFEGTALFDNNTLIASGFDMFIAKLGCDYLPVVNFSYTIDTTFTVSFTDSSVNAGTYFWDFGDGNTDSVANPQHTYPVADSTYMVCLISTNPCDVDTICQTIQLGCPAPVAKFSYMDSVFTVNFADSSQNAVNYYWDFGDGNTDTIASTQHTYAFADSVYIACLTVTNACGKDSTICDSITIICPVAVAKFSYVDSGLTVNFADSSMNAVSWFWNFGDGADTTVASPQHTYPPVDSTYNVCLTVTNVCGKDSVFCDSVTISCPVPVAKFVYSDTFSTVSFFDSSSNAVSWFWDFGDGNTHVIANPQHTYFPVDSAYYVCLTVTSVCGKDSTICDSVTVTLTGIDQSLFSKYQLKVYPNPNTGAFVIELNLPDVQNVELKLFNVSGKLIYNENIKQLSDTFKKEIKLKDHSKGIYYLQVIIPNIKVINKKIIIE